MGGYRPGSGRSKTGYYRGIYCGSTYELCWVIYSLDHGIAFTRFPNVLIWDGVKYFPDFLLDDGNTIVEIKGYESPESVAKKTAVAENNGYTVVVLRKEQLLHIFEYVSKVYSKNYQSLYDDYKPQYSYLCGQCQDSFSRDRKLKTDVVFCCKSCAGLFRKETRQRATESNNYVRKLSDIEALEVFNASGSYAEIAMKFSISKNNVWGIKRKHTYKWIHN